MPGGAKEILAGVGGLGLDIGMVGSVGLIVGEMVTVGG